MMKTRRTPPPPVFQNEDDDQEVVLLSNNNNNNNNGGMSSSIAMTSIIRYGECQRNHAASIGGYAVDGCREFMASGEEGTTGALFCAACGCHRNFHHRQVDLPTELLDEVVCSSAPSTNYSFSTTETYL